jgi:hypothetical protein
MVLQTIPEKGGSGSVPPSAMITYHIQTQFIPPSLHPPPPPPPTAPLPTAKKKNVITVR